MAQFPAVRWPKLRRVLERRPLFYKVVRESGSHRRLEAPDRPSLILAFHNDEDIPPGLVRKILVKDIGLGEAEALALIRGKRGGTE